MGNWRVYGTDRAVGALGIMQPFRIDVEAADRDGARAEARSARYRAGREHVLCTSERQICPNCGSAALAAAIAPAEGRCRECAWPLGPGAPAVPDAPLCSVCRRRHGREIQHAAE